LLVVIQWCILPLVEVVDVLLVAAAVVLRRGSLLLRPLPEDLLELALAELLVHLLTGLRLLLLCLRVGVALLRRHEELHALLLRPASCRFLFTCCPSVCMVCASWFNLS